MGTKYGVYCFVNYLFINECLIVRAHKDSKEFIKSTSEILQHPLGIIWSDFLFIYLFIYYLFQLYLMLVQLIPFANEDQKYFQKQKTKKNYQK